MDVLSWDERSILNDRGYLPSVSYDRLDPPGSDVDLIDRYRGALVGLGVGDALGKPIEGLPADEIEHRHGLVNRFLSAPLPRLLLPPGQVSRETQLALLIAATAISTDRMEPRDLAQRIGAWLPIARKPGRSTSAAARALRNGTPWTHAGQHSAGTGALSRSVVTALMTPFDLDHLRMHAAVQTIITNSDHSAIAASVASAAIVAHLLSTSSGAFRPDAMVETVERALVGITDPAVQLRHQAVVSTLMERIRLAVDSHHLTAAEAYATFGTGGFVLEAVPMAVWAFTRHVENPVAAIIVAVNGGGATSAIGALTGAFAGAYHGAEAMPQPWVEHLEYVDGLAGHADVLAASAGLGKAVQPFRSFDVLRPATYAPFSLGGTTMATLEHAIRSAAAADPSAAVKVRLAPTPADARRHATMSPQRPDWPTTAHGTVAAILKRRFADHDPARARLDVAAPEDIHGAAELFAADPFDYSALLEERRNAMAEV